MFDDFECPECNSGDLELMDEYADDLEFECQECGCIFGPDDMD